MPVWFNVGKDVLQTIAALVAAGAIIFASFTYKTAKNQLGFSVIASCITRFQALLGDFDRLEALDDTQRRRLAKRYIDLCNEELFYYQMTYVPEQIIDEWIDGMLSYLPLQDEQGQLIYATYKLLGVNSDFDLDDYPRIGGSFRVQRRNDLPDDDERLKAYITEIKERVRQSPRSNTHASATKRAVPVKES